MTPDLYASKPGKTPIENWDYYLCATFGVFSARASEVLSPFFGDRFETLPAKLEGHEYFCLRCCRRLDCLNAKASRIIYFDEEPKEIMTIEKYVFNTKTVSRDIVFAIPESKFGLYCTDEIPKAAKKAKLKDIKFRIIDR